MASRPASMPFDAAELAYGGIVARGLWVLSAVLLVLLVAWSTGPV